MKNVASLRRRFAALLGVLALGLSAEAFAQKPLVVVFTRFSGPGAKASAAQLEESVCEKLMCVPPRPTRKGDGPRRDVDAIVFGKVTKVKRGKYALKLSVVDPDMTALARVVLPLKSDRSLKRLDLKKGSRTILLATTEARRASGAPRDADDATDEVESLPVASRATMSEDPAETSLDTAATHRGSVEEGTNVLAAAPAPVSKVSMHEVLHPGDSPQDEGSAGGHGEMSAALASHAGRPLWGNARPWLVLQLDGKVTSRLMGFSSLVTPVRSPSASSILTPSLKLEVHPVESIGLGVEAKLSQSLGNAAVAQAAGTGLSMSNQELALTWRFQPAESLELKPLVGLRRHATKVNRAEAGPFVDAPSVDYRGFTVGAAGTWAMTASLGLEARAAYMGIFSSGDLISESFFRAGRSHGLELSGGVAWAAFARWQLVGTGSMDYYSHAFATLPDDSYVAAGAADRYLGLSLGIRTGF